MKLKKHSIVSNILLIIFICLNLANINAGRFDGDPPPETEVVEVTETPDEDAPPVESTPPAPVVTEETPTEEPVATEEPSVTEEPSATEEPPVEEPAATELPPTEEPVATEEAIVDEEPAPEEEPVTELLSDVPENTEVVVLDENGEAVPLVTQEAADIVIEEDPMWCPAGVLPGGAGCTINYTSISALINELRGSNRPNYEQDGIIYFTSGNTGGSFSLTRSSIGTSDFYALNDYNLTLQGGWNGANGGSATFTGTTYFNNGTRLTIGDSSRRWHGNISLNNFRFNNVSSGNAITVYTSSGDISLDNVIVTSQRGYDYTAYLDSYSGDITVDDSYFDGNRGRDNRGFSAETDNGKIEISNTTFQDANRRGRSDYNGARLEAPVITLTNVTSRNNDGYGFFIDDAENTSLTLNNVSALNNGHSGIYLDINSPNNSTVVTVNGGSFINNGGYGIEFERGRGTLYVTSDPSCSGNRYYGYDGCYNIRPTTINQAPVLNLPNNIFAEATGPSGAAVSFSVTATDAQDDPDPIPTCSPASGSYFAIDTTTTVDCSVTDSDGNTTEGSFTITVRDTRPPVLSLPSSRSVEATGPSGAVVNYSATATDLVDGPVPVNCSPASGSTFSIGWWRRVNCSASDTRGNTSYGRFYIRVRDTTPPVLNLPGNITREATGPSGATVNFSVSTTDIVDSSPYLYCNRSSGDTFPIGTTTVSCWTRDWSWNWTSGSFTVTVVDTTPPALTLPSDITEEATGPSGAVVNFSASATDIVDGSRPVTCSPASGSTFGLGTTTVNCSASDTRGNTANGSFNVTVQDTTPPTLTLPSNITEEATGPSGAVVTFSATATDIVDTTPAVSCTPVSGSTFPLGTTTVNCSATDDSGNVTNGSFDVTVQDTTPPTLTLPSDITEEATGPSGAVATFSVSAVDIVSGSLPVTCSEVSGSTFPIGITTVNCSATDGAGNTASGSFTITVQDKTPPVIAPHKDILLGTWKVQKQVNYSPPTTSDIVDGAGVATCSPAPGSMFPIGVTVVTCTAIDSAGNIATPVTFTITVEKVDKPATSATSTFIPVTGGSMFDVSCIDPAINTLLPPGAKITFINLCGYQAVVEEVLTEMLPETLPSDASFVNGVTINVFQDDDQVQPLPDDASILLGLPTPVDTEGEYAILYWDGSNWVELNSQNNENGFVDVTSDQTGIFILAAK